MVDYSLTAAPQAPHLKEAGPLEMEELAVMALLECPLCFEQLDLSAKVLPCQHTFCMSCLQKHQAAHAPSPLLCPDCRAPVPARTVEELPANLLLVRLLEGLQVSPRPSRNRQRARYSVPSSVREGQQQLDNQQSELSVRGSNRNLLTGLSVGTLVPAGPSISPKHKVDNRYQGGDGDPGRAMPAASQASVAEHLQQSQPAALCKALFDFNPSEMNLEDRESFLSFQKGDILTVIRRLDENWIEAKSGDKVGVCPLQFTEPNSVAAKLLEGKNRRGSDSADYYHRTWSGGKDKVSDVPAWSTHYGVPQFPAKTVILNALPTSDQRKQPSASSVNFYQPSKGETSNRAVTSSNHHLSALPAARGHSHTTRASSQPHRRRTDSHRHLLQTVKKMNSETPPTISMALVNPQMPSVSADGKNSSTQQLSISVCAVLYSYNPRRPEELELKKGEMVGVYGKFKEGWLRGLSLRTGRVGILPSNYISPVLRTSARLLETRAANATSQHNTVTGKRPAAAKNPSVFLALDRVNSDAAVYSAGTIPPVPDGAQHAVSSINTGKPSLYGSSQGWDTVRRIFNPQRGTNQMAGLDVPSNLRHFAQVQASGYSPALHRKKSSGLLSSSGRLLNWMTESTAPPAAAIHKDREFLGSQEATFQHDRPSPDAPQSILVRPDSNKSNIDKPAKSVRFLTDEDSPPLRRRTSSWSSGTQIPSNCHHRPPPLEVWAPSLTLGRDGPGIILKEGKVSVQRKGLETATSDLNSNPQKPTLAQPPLSAASAQFSPIRHVVTSTHLAQTDSELSLLQGELVLVHRPRPDGRVLITQESSGQTGLFHCGVFQSLEKLS
ncbi:hypothetical protein fugu_013242 [Takifugu bimaculatus]|uniref:RING-type E3 ubiquitin transferase n=1 Tax=Takifugu bimaculatus TaxID=433685 RepID=A0A4Z2C3S2_9TELE|nr:hypothetical protein fugu_013242 [Takifugu bimaculatus]